MSPPGVVSTLCLHNVRRERDVHETWEELLPLCERWELRYRFRKGRFRLRSSCWGGFCGGAQGEMLAHKGLLQKPFSAFLTLITCFPAMGLARVLEGAVFSWVLAGCCGAACAMDVSSAYPGHAVHERRCSMKGSTAPSPRCSDLGLLSRSPACLPPKPSPGGMK